MPAHPPPRPRTTLQQSVGLSHFMPLCCFGLVRPRRAFCLASPSAHTGCLCRRAPAAAADERSGFRRHITLSCRAKQQELTPPAPLVLRPLPAVSHRPSPWFPPPETELRLHPHCSSTLPGTPRWSQIVTASDCVGLLSRLLLALLLTWPFELLPLLYSPALLPPLRSSPHCLFQSSSYPPGPPPPPSASLRVLALSSYPSDIIL